MSAEIRRASLADCVVSLLVDLDAQRRQPAQNVAAHRRDVLTDTGGEADHIGAAKHRQVGTDVFAQPVDEHVIS